jgi:hypothetical protein
MWNLEEENMKVKGGLLQKKLGIRGREIREGNGA